MNALFKLVNPVFTKDGDNLKVSVSVKYLDNKSKMTQISQYELVLHKDDNWKLNKIAARWSAKAVAQLSFSQ